MKSKFSTFLSKTDHTLLAIICISFVSLLFRIINLGSRVAHWDEGRVGYDILRYVDTGIWQYRPIVHGAFLPQINHYIFEFAGAVLAGGEVTATVRKGILDAGAFSSNPDFLVVFSRPQMGSFCCTADF